MLEDVFTLTLRHEQDVTEGCFTKAKESVYPTIYSRILERNEIQQLSSGFELRSIPGV